MSLNKIAIWGMAKAKEDFLRHLERDALVPQNFSAVVTSVDEV